MRRELEYFFAALRFFTRLPAPAWVGHSAEQLNHAARYFPAVGIIVGAIGAAVTLIAALALPTGIAVLLGMVATLLATGAFHEDGLADSVDGFGGAPACSGGGPGAAGGEAPASGMQPPDVGVAGAASASTVAPSPAGEGTAPRSGGAETREDVLRIMKDSRIGSYGAIGIGLALLIKFEALTNLGGVSPWLTFLAALVAGHSVSRFASTTLIYALDYAREDASSKSKPLATRMGKGELAIAALFGLAPCVLLPVGQVGIALVAVVFVTLAAARYFVKRIGGYTGDCLGATQQLTEIAFYLGLLCARF